MIDNRFNTGTDGIIELQDKTDTPDNTVDIFVMTYPTVPTQQDMPWAYSIDGVRSSWMTFNIDPQIYTGHLGIIYVGYALQFTFHLGDTGTTELGGPADFTIDLQRGSNTKQVSIKVDGAYKKAIPFVRDGGVWKPVEPWAMSAGEWKPTT